MPTLLENTKKSQWGERCIYTGKNSPCRPGPIMTYLVPTLRVHSIRDAECPIRIPTRSVGTRSGQALSKNYFSAFLDPV